MGIIQGYQDVWRVGSMVLFQRDAIDGVGQPLVDLGTIQAASGQPNNDVQRVELFDPRTGINIKVDSGISQITETYNLILHNFALSNIALAFSCDPPETFTQTAGAVTDITHNDIHEGHLFGLLDSNGDRIYRIASIESITQGSATWAADEDYEIVDLELGLLRVLEGGSNQTGTGTPDRVFDVLVDYTKTAYSGKRLLHPQAGFGEVAGYFELVWSRENNVRRTVRRGTCKISSSGENNNFTVEEYATLGLTLEITADLTNATSPAGEIIDIKGDLPSKS